MGAIEEIKHEGESYSRWIDRQHQDMRRMLFERFLWEKIGWAKMNVDSGNAVVDFPLTPLVSDWSVERILSGDIAGKYALRVVHGENNRRLRKVLKKEGAEGRPEWICWPFFIRWNEAEKAWYSFLDEPWSKIRPWGMIDWNVTGLASSLRCWGYSLAGIQSVFVDSAAVECLQRIYWGEGGPQSGPRGHAGRPSGAAKRRKG